MSVTEIITTEAAQEGFYPTPPAVAADALREKAERENHQPLTPVQEWVSVKDRLPDVGCDVLFVCENKSCGVGAYSDTYRDFFSGKFPAKGVTHWMPLPEPPKEV